MSAAGAELRNTSVDAFAGIADEDQESEREDGGEEEEDGCGGDGDGVAWESALDDALRDCYFLAANVIAVDASARSFF